MPHCPYSQETWQCILSKLNLATIHCNGAQELLLSVLSRLDQQSDSAITLGKFLFNAFVWLVQAKRNARIFRLTSKSSSSVVQHITYVVTTTILYLGLTLPISIQCHWNIPSNDQAPITRLVAARIQGWCLSIVPTSHNLIGIMWRDLHYPVKGQIVLMLNYYEGVYQILPRIPPMVSSLTVEANFSLQQSRLHPYHFEWAILPHQKTSCNDY